MIDLIKEFFIFSLEFKVYWLAPIVAVDQKVCINVSLHEFSSDVSIVFFPSLTDLGKWQLIYNPFLNQLKQLEVIFLASFAKLLDFFLSISEFYLTTWIQMKFWIVFYYYLIICVGLPCVSFISKGVFSFILNFDLIPIFIRKIYALTFNYIQTQGGLEHWETSVQLSMSQQHWKRCPWSPHHQKTRSTTTSGGLVSSVWPTYDLSIYNHFSIRCALRLKQTAFSPRQLDRIYLIYVWYI